MAMTPNEERLLRKCFSEATAYLEFGSGESTRFAVLSSSIEKIVSVESSRDFVTEYFSDDEGISRAQKSDRLRFHIVDIGKIKDWGIPADKSKRHLWPNYPLSVFRSPSDYDLVLIDGRFRAACVLTSLLNTSDSCRIIVHDFTVYPELFFLLRFLMIENQEDTLVVFRKRKNLNPKRIQRLIRKYQYLPQDKNFWIRIKAKLLKIFISRRCLKSAISESNRGK